MGLLGTLAFILQLILGREFLHPESSLGDGLRLRVGRTGLEDDRDTIPGKLRVIIANGTSLWKILHKDRKDRRTLHLFDD